ncbi:MAG: hypothetical protein HOP28_14680 [Gemmatimonadales bacterium]|nr:hypothetical protein [Gemmatimonadales bacterium]
MATSLRERLIRLLGDRAPNFVPDQVLNNRLQPHEPSEIAVILTALEADAIIERRDDPRDVSLTPQHYYRLKAYKGMPVRTSIALGGLELPRLLSDSAASLFPEILNESLELLSEYNASLEKRFQELVSAQERRYWAKVAGLFAALVSVLALVLVALPKIAVDPSLTFWKTVQVNLAQVLPLAIVLALFCLTIRRIVR